MLGLRNPAIDQILTSSLKSAIALAKEMMRQYFTKETEGLDRSYQTHQQAIGSDKAL